MHQNISGPYNDYELAFGVFFLNEYFGKSVICQQLFIFGCTCQMGPGHDLQTKS